MGYDQKTWLERHRYRAEITGMVIVKSSDDYRELLHLADPSVLQQLAGLQFRPCLTSVR